MKPFSPFRLSTVSIAADSTGSNNVALSKPNDLTSCQVEIFNAGSVPVFITKGDSTVTASAATSRPIAPGATVIDTIGASTTHFAARTGSGSATVYFTTGEGN